MSHEDDGHGHDHHADDATAVAFGVLTVSTSRTLESDASGDAIVEVFEGTPHSVAARDLVADDESAIRDRIESWLADDTVDAVLTTGGTGLTPDDVTPAAAGALFDREIPGFGEQFRARSVDQVGPHGMLTRATAGVASGKPIFCLPGSVDAASFGTAELVVPIVGHVVGLADDSGHDHGGSP